MSDVCLVSMPYASIQRPSIALGILKACLKQNGIATTVFYPNLWFAEEIPLDIYNLLSNVPIIGEWTFSKAAFPDFQPNIAGYIELAKQESQAFRSLSDAKQKEIGWQIGEQAISFIDRVAKSILERQPKLVGCSSTFQQHCASLALLRRIKELNPEVVTFMGGANCEEEMGLTTIREFPWVDFVLSGEGEDAIVPFCRTILDCGRNVDPTELPYGVITPFHHQAPRSSVMDLDRIPTPDYDDYFATLKASRLADCVEPGLVLETSRGCWWGQKQHCTFCGANGASMKYRSKSSEKAIAEITELSQRYGLRRFQVVDNILDLDYINTVLPVLAEREAPYLFCYETKANLKREQVRQLAEAGVRWIQPGIEHLHDKALALIKKGTTGWINVQLLKWCRQYGIIPCWNFLCDIPGESDEWYEEIADWLPLLSHLQPPVGSYSIRYDRFSPYHQRPAEWGLNLVPNRLYGYIYPLSSESLAGLAYFFDDPADWTRRQPNERGIRTDRPGLEALYRCIETWQNRWRKLAYAAEPPMLSMINESDRLTVTDTRLDATERTIVLTGLAADVYQACDRAMTAQSLVDMMGSKVDIILAELCDRKIMLAIGDRFLSLAVEEPYSSLPKLLEFPGGYIKPKKALLV